MRYFKIFQKYRPLLSFTHMLPASHTLSHSTTVTPAAWPASSCIFDLFSHQNLDSLFLCQVDWPISLVLNHKALARYQMLFRYTMTFISQVENLWNMYKQYSNKGSGKEHVYICTYYVSIPDTVMMFCIQTPVLLQAHWAVDVVCLAHQQSYKVSARY